MALLMSLVLVASACGTGGDPSASPSPAALMDRLARLGDHGLFDTSYVGPLGDQAVLYVGTKGGSAVGYLCDPTAGSRWFVGTSASDRIDLKDARGGALSGQAAEGRIDAALTGIPGYDGPIVLEPADADDHIARQRDVAAGQVVGGLVRRGDVISGVITASATSLPQPSGAKASSEPITIGLLVKLGATIDVTIATNPVLTNAGQKAVEDAARRAMAEAKDMAAVMAVTMIVVAVILIAIVVAVFTFGAADPAVTSGLVEAVKQGNLAGRDVTTNAFVSSALKDIAGGVLIGDVPTSSARSTTAPAGTGSAIPALGALTFTSLTGKP